MFGTGRPTSEGLRHLAGLVIVVGQLHESLVNLLLLSFKYIQIIMTAHNIVVLAGKLCSSSRDKQSTNWIQVTVSAPRY
jgi:hypothetical protein